MKKVMADMFKKHPGEEIYPNLEVEKDGRLYNDTENRWNNVLEGNIHALRCEVSMKNK